MWWLFFRWTEQDGTTTEIDNFMVRLVFGFLFYRRLKIGSKNRQTGTMEDNCVASINYT